MYINIGYSNNMISDQGVIKPALCHSITHERPNLPLRLNSPFLFPSTNQVKTENEVVDWILSHYHIIFFRISHMSTIYSLNVVELGLNVSSFAHNCGCVVDGGGVMAVI